jgi:hypothetical protein
MKIFLLTIICLTLISGSALSQTAGKKTDLFNDIKALRLQYLSDKYYLNSIENFGEGNKYTDDRVRLSQTKIKIDSLDKEYTKLLSIKELNEYLVWKRGEDVKEKIQNTGWWYPVLTRKGC